MNTWTRTGLALVLGLSIGTFISFINGRDFVSALQAGFGFALLVGFIVGVCPAEWISPSKRGIRVGSASCWCSV
jgi:hypothetical protein